MDQCVMFADISGSTRLYEKVGDVAARQLMAEFLGILTRIVESHRGRVVKTIGDEVLCVFLSAGEAALAACQMQVETSNHRSARMYAMAVRIGFNFGSVVEDDGDVFGDTVNTAARLTDLAKAGQILTVTDTAALLPVFVRAAARQLGSFRVKGKAEAIDVSEVIWHEDGMTMMAGRGDGEPIDSDSAARQSVLRVGCGGESYFLQITGGQLGIGRDAGSDIPTASPYASRTHARIEKRGDRFVLIDLSTNGTYLQEVGDKETFLRRDEAGLRRQGTIRFGQSHELGAADMSYEISEETGR